MDDRTSYFPWVFLHVENDQRRSTSPSAHRSQRAAERVAPGLAFARLLSRKEISPLDAVPWSSRDLLIRDENGATLLDRRDVEVPGDWSQGAVHAFLRAETDAGKADTASIREVLTERHRRLREEGMVRGYFLREEDATIFADEVLALSLAQGVAFGTEHRRAQAPAAAPRERSWIWQGTVYPLSASAWDTGDEKPEAAAPEPRWHTLDAPDLGALLAGRQSFQAPAGLDLLALPDEMMLAVEHMGGGESALSTHRSSARELLDCIADSTLRTGSPALCFTNSLLRWHGTRGTEPVERLASSGEPWATLNLSRFLTTAGEFDLPAFRHAVQLVTTALEIELAIGLEGSGDLLHAARDARPLAIQFGNFGSLLMESGIAYDSPLARTLGSALAAILCGDAFWQSARIAETCPPVVGDGDAGAEGEEPRSGGACLAFQQNQQEFLEVIRLQRAEANRIAATSSSFNMPETAGVVLIRAETSSEARGYASPAPLAQQLPSLVAAARSAWDGALTHGETFGFRNARVTAFSSDTRRTASLDCRTTALDPMHGLLAWERRAAAAGRGGRATPEVPAALFRLGYSAVESDTIVASLEATGDLDGAPFLRAEDLQIFAYAPGNDGDGDKGVAPVAVLRMMAAVQPFVTAANPFVLRVRRHDGTQEITRYLMEAWRSGIKSVAIARATPMIEEAEPISAAEPPTWYVPHSGWPVSDPAGAAPTMTGAFVVSGQPTQATPLEQPAFGERSDPRAAEALSSVPKAQRPTDRPFALPGHGSLSRAGGNVRATEMPTLADAELSLLAREHAALLETQLHRISELEEQIHSLQSAARESADAFDAKEPPRTVRHRLPAERASMTHAFNVGGHEGWITVGLYPNGSPGEISLRMAKESSMVAGLLDSFATAISLALQHGVPLRVLADHYAETRFEPSGPTPNDAIPYARSLMDYIFRWMELRFLSGQQMSLFANLGGGPGSAS